MPATTRRRTRLNLPANSMVEREYIVTYSTRGCNCDHCRREKTVLAFTHSDARSRFIRSAPLADVINVR